MKTMILLSIFVLLTASCAPSQGPSPAASPTLPATLAPPTLVDTIIPPTEGPGQPTAPSASETPTPAAPLETSTTASISFTGAVQIAGGSCTVATPVVRCTLASLPAGGSVAGSVSATARKAGTASIRAHISGGYVDPNSVNDGVERTIHVVATPDAATPAPSATRKGGGGAFGALLLLALGVLKLASRRRAVAVRR